jgi:hypothetical protein
LHNSRACLLLSLLVRVIETLRNIPCGKPFLSSGLSHANEPTGSLWRYIINRLDLQSNLQNSSIVLPSIFACPFDRCGVRGTNPGLETRPRSCNPRVDVFLHPGTDHSHKGVSALNVNCQMTLRLCEHRASSLSTVLVTSDIRRPVSPVARAPLLRRPRSPVARYCYFTPLVSLSAAVPSTE